MATKKKRAGGFQPKVPANIACMEMPDAEGSVAVPSTVQVRRTRRSKEGEAVFDWAEKQFYVLACFAPDGDPVSVDKDVRMLYEVIMLPPTKGDAFDGEYGDKDEATGGAVLHSSSTSKTWQRKFFWFNAVNLRAAGHYLLRFTPESKNLDADARAALEVQLP